MTAQFEAQADKIEETLAGRGIIAQVTGGTITPHWVRFWTWPRLGTRLSHIKALNGELATVLSADNCRVSRRRLIGAQIEIPRPVVEQ